MPQDRPRKPRTPKATPIPPDATSGPPDASTPTPPTIPARPRRPRLSPKAARRVALQAAAEILAVRWDNVMIFADGQDPTTGWTYHGTESIGNRMAIRDHVDAWISTARSVQRIDDEDRDDDDDDDGPCGDPDCACGEDA